MAVYDDQDTKTKVDDDELRKITGISEDEEKQMENDAVHDGSTAEDSEREGLSEKSKNDDENEEKPKSNTAKDEDEGGLFTGTGGSKGLVGRFKASSSAKKWAVAAGAGLLMSIVGGIIAFIAFLLPFKVTHIINQIENKVGQVPEYAVEQRLEYYMNRYLIIRALENTPGAPDVNNGRYVYIGDGVFSTLYTNWRGANLEGKLLEMGYRIEANPTRGEITGRNRVRPTNWNFVDINKGTSVSMTAKESRAFFKEFAKDQTKSSQVFKRYNMRKMLRQYYGVNNWKFFEERRENARRSYIEKKTAIKTSMVERVVTPVSERYGIYLNCLLNGGNTCRDDLGRAAVVDENPDIPERTDPETGDRTGGGGAADAQNATSDTDIRNFPGESTDIAGTAINNGATGAPGESAEKAVSRRIASQIRELGLKKILASFVAGLGILEAISQVVNSVETGALNIVVYDKNSQQYANYAAPVLSMADQIRASDVTSDDARLLNEIFNNYQESPVYQTQFGSSSGTVSALSMSGDQLLRDCDDDPSTPDELLAPGEVVCPGKKLVQNETEFTSNSGWRALVSASNAYRNTVGSIVGFFTDIVDAAAEALGVSALIERAMEELGITDLAASAFSYIMNIIAGPVITGAEVEGDAYEALFAGMTVNSASIGGGVGVEREGTIGGGYLDDEDLIAISNAQTEQKNYAKSQQSITERYLSLENTDSFASSMAMKTPNSVTELSTNIASIPSSIFANLSSLFNLRVGAQIPANPNPFDAIFNGYAPNHPVFTANGGEGMDPEELKETYQCDLPYDQRPQNQDIGRPPGGDIPFDIQLSADPCLLEVAVEAAGSRFFTGEYDDIGSTNTVTSPEVTGETFPCTGQNREVVRKPGGFDAADWSGIPVSETAGNHADGTPINVYIREACSSTDVKTVVIVGSIHGSENGGQLVAHEMLFNADLDNNVRVIAIPELCSCAGTGNRSSGSNIDPSNGFQVDLNRNYAYNWSPGTQRFQSGNTYSRGPSAESEPETRAMTSYLRGLGEELDLFVVYHDALGWVAAAGGTDVELARIYSGFTSDTPLRAAENGKVYQAGSIDGWVNAELTKPSLLVELTNNQPPNIIEGHVNALREVLRSDRL